MKIEGNGKITYEESDHTYNTNQAGEIVCRVPKSEETEPFYHLKGTKDGDCGQNLGFLPFVPTYIDERRSYPDEKDGALEFLVPTWCQPCNATIMVKARVTKDSKTKGVQKQSWSLEVV